MRLKCGEILDFKCLFLNNPKRREAILLILCVLVGFGLRAYTFDQKSLWVDEIYTLNDSRDDIRGQLEYYKKNPNYPQAPLFFVLTHLFYPFSNPERDLRILPLIFGTLSIPLLYFLARLFSPAIAFPCVLSLTFMTYHISLSQDARSYSLVMFLGISGLYFLMKYLLTLRRRYLFHGAFFMPFCFIQAIALSRSWSFLKSSGFIKRIEKKAPDPFRPFSCLMVSFYFCASRGFFIFKLWRPTDYSTD